MASTTGHAVCFEELYGTGANEHYNKFCFLVCGWKLIEEVKMRQ